MTGKSSEFAVAGELKSDVWWRVRDPLMWAAVSSALAIKLLVVWLQLGVFVRSSWLRPLFADLRGWTRFMRAVRAGQVPYLDVPCDAPVLTGWFYWLVAKLSVWLPFDPARPFYTYHAVLMGAVDVVNAGLIYSIARGVQAHSGLRASLVFTLTLGALSFGPTHVDGLFVTSLLVAYKLQERPRAAAAAWSLAAGFHGFGFLGFIAAELQRFTAGDRSRWRLAWPVFAAIQLLANGPLLLAGWQARGELVLFRGVLELEPAHYAPNTALGLVQLWFGTTVLHRWALPLSAALAGWAIVRMRRATLPETIVVVAIAGLIVYPHAGASWQLWLYPFLLVIALRAASEPRAWLLTAYAALDVALALSSSFLLARAKREVGAFEPGAALGDGAAAFTLLFSAVVVIKLVLLGVVLRELVRGALPAAALPAPLGWPQIDRARWTGWLAHRSVPAWIAWAFIVGQSLYIGSVVWGSERYSDEVYHVPQVERFARGDGKLDDRITTLPGFHIVTALLANARGELGLPELRQLNLGWGLAATFFAFLCLRTLGARQTPARAVGLHFLPMLLPYMFFVFTDVLGLALVMLTVYLMLNQRWAVAGFVGAVSISVRQSNALVLVLVGLVALLEEDRARGFWIWLRSLAAKTWTAALGLAGFLVFVIRNDGVTIGDRDYHELGLHIGNLVFVLFLVAVCALPANLERIWNERARLREGGFLLALAVLYFTYAYLFELEHVYNTHTEFLRNALVSWATGNALTKSLFFLPVALGFAALWVTPLAKRSLWVWVVVGLLTVLPESLVEQRYAIVPIALWTVFRRDASPIAEGLTAVLNAAVSVWLLKNVVAGTFLL